VKLPTFPLESRRGGRSQRRESGLLTPNETGS